ncbi:MAG: hypothetical protein ACOX8U_09075 [Bradymonadia bacterium]|jgi:hypothetical protein
MMLRNSSLLLFFLFSSTLVLGCVEKEPQLIYTPDESVQAYPRDVGDCIVGCPHPYNANTDLYEHKSGGLFNVIDDDCHLVDSQLYSADVDFIGIDSTKVKPGDALEITVKPAPHSLLNPVLSVYDKFGKIMMVNLGQEGRRDSRVEFLLPKSLPIYVAVEGLENYQLGHKASCSELKKRVGGKYYGYLLKVDTIAGVSGKEIGKIAVGDEKRERATLEKPGMAHYYFFTAPKGSKITVYVNPSTAANEKMRAILSGLKLSDKSLDWIRVGGLQKEDSNLLIQTDFSPLADETDSTLNKYGFVVFDYSGKGGADFTYDLTVKVGP